MTEYSIAISNKSKTTSFRAVLDQICNSDSPRTFGSNLGIKFKDKTEIRNVCQFRLLMNMRELQFPIWQRERQMNGDSKV